MTQAIDLIFILLIGFVIGVIVVFLISKRLITIKTKELENTAYKVSSKLNDDWSIFHRQELDNWEKKSAEAVRKAYVDACNDRDKVWKTWYGKQKNKAKPPSN